MSFPSRPIVKPAKDKVRNYFELFHDFNMASVTPSLSSESLQSPQAASEGSNDAGPAQREEISPSMRAKIWALYHIANWPFRKITSVTGIALIQYIESLNPLLHQNEIVSVVALFCFVHHSVKDLSQLQLIALFTAVSRLPKLHIWLGLWLVRLPCGERWLLRDTLAEFLVKSLGYHQKTSKYNSLFFFFFFLTWFFPSVRNGVLAQNSRPAPPRQLFRGPAIKLIG